VAIVASWGDARFGTLANVVVLTAVTYGAFAWGPLGLRADYVRHASRALESLPAQPASLITEADPRNYQVDTGEKKTYFEISDFSTYVFYENPN